MRVLAHLISILAVWLLRHEWTQLRSRLAQVYEPQINGRIGGPSALAQQLLISGEDHRFFHHGGIDLVAVCRALWRAVALGRMEGASTIEMQVVRVLTGRRERTLWRKIREMALATLVTREIPKSALPGVYLRLGYFGWRMNGFDAACDHLGLRSETLSPIDTAQLVARLKYPQPREVPPRRWQQIDTRAHHLLKLHLRHRHDHTYRGLVKELAYATV